MQWGTGELRVINRNSLREVTEVRQFLEQFQLSYDSGQVDYTVALYQDNRIIATGSLQGEVLRNFAVDETLQGEGLAAQVVSALLSEASQRGIYHYFIYTKPDKAHLFSALGFQLLACVKEHAALLESGIGTVEQYCRSLAQAATIPEQGRAALVVNCNPFTLGHQAVITKAAEENEGVIVLVVSEDRSLFPFPVRLRLIREGLAHLPNVAVLPGGKYIVSAATFPGYFTRGEATVAAQTRLDATLFATRIAPALGIAVRYVGEEPYCAVTNAYNEALREILPQHGIAVRVIPRIEVSGEAISASRVREMIRADRWDQIRDLVPEVTYRYLTSPEAEPVLASIRQNQSRH